MLEPGTACGAYAPFVRTADPPQGAKNHGDDKNAGDEQYSPAGPGVLVSEHQVIVIPPSTARVCPVM